MPQFKMPTPVTAIRLEDADQIVTPIEEKVSLDFDAKYLETVKRALTKARLRDEQKQRSEQDEETIKEHLQKVPPFELFSAEPTFLFDYKKHPLNKLLNFNQRDVLLDVHVELIKDHFIKTKFKRNWFYDCECDGGNLELNTGIYSNVNQFIIDYHRHAACLSKYMFYPSSAIDLEIEGGCHLNFDCTFIRRRGEAFYKDFGKNLITFFNNCPSLVWLFLSDNDNQSSCLNKDLTVVDSGKGDFLRFVVSYLNLTQIQKLPSLYQDNYFFKTQDSWRPYKSYYVELRMFKMFTTTVEFKLYYDYCRAILLYVYNLTVAGKQIVQARNVSPKKYKYSKACFEIQAVCDVIDFDFGRITRDAPNTFKILRKRFTNGPQYLV
jgi:hypothetical protein